MEALRIAVASSIIGFLLVVSLQTSTETISGELWLPLSQEEYVYLPFSPSKITLRLTYLSLTNNPESSFLTPLADGTYTNPSSPTLITVSTDVTLHKTQHVVIVNDVINAAIIKYDIEATSLNLYEYIYYDHQYLFYAIVIVGTVFTQAVLKYFR